MRQHLVAHSWPKRRLEDWLNHAALGWLSSQKTLQMRLFRGVRCLASWCPTRSVTPEVAGSSPVAPVQIPANWHIALSVQTPDRSRPHRLHLEATRSDLERAGGTRFQADSGRVQATTRAA